MRVLTRNLQTPSRTGAGLSWPTNTSAEENKKERRRIKETRREKKREKERRRERREKRGSVTGRVACKQMVPKDERRSIEGEGKERNLTGQVVTAIYIKGRGAPA